MSSSRLISSKVSLVVLLLSLNVCLKTTAHAEPIANRNRRDLTSAIGSVFTCPKAVAEVGAKCMDKLKERIDLKEKVEDKTDSDAPGAFNCCYMAEFSHCVSSDSQVEKECGKDTANSINGFLSGSYQTLSQDCKDYTYYSATCLFVVWLNVIIICIVVSVLLSVGCCIGKWMCSRR